jgi:toxin HigB-1
MKRTAQFIAEHPLPPAGKVAKLYDGGGLLLLITGTGRICRLPGNSIGWRVAIRAFKCKDTEELFNTEKSRRFGAIRKVATRKLTMLQAATVLEDLKSPPGNRLEALVSDRAGQHSIRINDQFRICFVWTDSGPMDVEITNHYA